MKSSATFVRLGAVLLTVSILGPVRASDQIPAPPQRRPVALVGGTIYPVSAPPVAGGILVFADGKITALGADAPIPPEAERIDVSGKRIYPGLIHAYSQIGLTEVGSVRGTQDQSEVGDINPNVHVEVAVNPGSEIIPVTRANGIALALVAPSGGIIAGRSAVMMLDGWTWEDMVFTAPAALHVIWPRMGVSRAWWVEQSEEEQKKTQREAQQRLRDAFRDARAYLTARAAAAEGGPPHPVDLRWEAMIPVFDGRLPVFVAADDIRQIQAAVAWAESEGLRLVIWGGADAWRVTDLLRERQVPVVVAGTHRMPARRWEPYDAPFTLPARLHEAGVTFCISGGKGWDGGAGAANERNLPYQAATAAAYGLPRDEALKAITLYPAEILGIADRVGSLEVGKDATLIVTDGDPLEIPTQVERLFIQGRAIDLSSRHTQLYDKYREKYRQKGN